MLHVHTRQAELVLAATSTQIRDDDNTETPGLAALRRDAVEAISPVATL